MRDTKCCESDSWLKLGPKILKSKRGGTKSDKPAFESSTQFSLLREIKTGVCFRSSLFSLFWKEPKYVILLGKITS